MGAGPIHKSQFSVAGTGGVSVGMSGMPRVPPIQQ